MESKYILYEHIERFINYNPNPQEHQDLLDLIPYSKALRVEIQLHREIRASIIDDHVQRHISIIKEVIAESKHHQSK